MGMLHLSKTLYRSWYVALLTTSINPFVTLTDHRVIPVVTRCSHYFCSACAIRRFTKTPKCAACGQPTGGMFNRADKVINKMQEKKKAKDGAEAEEAGDIPGGIDVEGLKHNDVDSDDDDGND